MDLLLPSNVPLNDLEEFPIGVKLFSSLVRSSQSEEHEKLTSLESPNMDGMPHSHNLHAMEDRILTGMERIKEMTDQYAMAREYMDWFTKAWNAQTEGDRYVLSRFYGGDEEYGSTAAADVAEHFDISTASAYRRKNRALSNLSLSLFGKHDVSDW